MRVLSSLEIKYRQWDQRFMQCLWSVPMQPLWTMFNVFTNEHMQCTYETIVNYVQCIMKVENLGESSLEYDQRLRVTT